MVTELRADAASAVTQSPSSATGSAEPKTGKEVVLAEVRRHRISLSTDSQGRDLLLIPPGYDGHSMSNWFGTPNTINTLPQQKSNVPNTLPQYQNAEEPWYQAGPEFQQGQTRFRSYGNTFDAGVVLPSFTDQRPFCAIKHSKTNLNKPPDICVDDTDIIQLRTVAHATAHLSGSTGSEREIGSGLTVIKA